MEESGGGVRLGVRVGWGRLIEVIRRSTNKETDPDQCQQATETGARSLKRFFPSFLHFILSSSQQTHIISSQSDMVL